MPGLPLIVFKAQGHIDQLRWILTVTRFGKPLLVDTRAFSFLFLFFIFFIFNPYSFQVLSLCREASNLQFKLQMHLQIPAHYLSQV